MSTFRLQDPIWLLLVMLAAIVVFHEIRRRRSRTVLYSSVRVLKTLPGTLALAVMKTLPAVRLIGLALVIVAMARPQLGREEFRIRTEGVAIQMVCDISGSMQAMDFEDGGEPVNRLAVVKRVFEDFVRGAGGLPGRPDDLIGLVAFGGFADSKCPLTLDHGALIEIVKSLEVARPVFDKRGRILNEELLQEEMATAIGDALALGLERIRDVEAKSKVLILLSDGEDNYSVVPPLDAAAAAEALGIKVYTIGIGSTGVAPFPAMDAFGKVVLTRRPVRLDEKLLQEIADRTGGKYFNARSTEALEEVYAAIDELEKTETEGRLYTEYGELFQVFLLAGIGLIVLELMFATTRFRSLP